MNLDFNHLEKTNIKYFSHAGRLLIVSSKLILLGFAGIIHAIFTMVMLTTVSEGVKKLADDIAHF
jgi:hypothetical protein